MTTAVPEKPAIFHITHIDNLPGIVQSRELVSDAKRIESKLQCSIVGMSEIKRRRLEELTVNCHPETKVGEYVPFYFCPRSIMLYILHRGNHPDVTYTGGQGPIVHLGALLLDVVNWANSQRRKWAFTKCNAGTRYASFFNSLDDLDKIDWQAVSETDFRQPSVKEGKQAEFLVFDSFPWELVSIIGVQNEVVKQQALDALTSAAYKPEVRVFPNWYF